MSITKVIEAAKESDSTNKRNLYKKFYAWYDALSEEDRNALDAALTSNEVSARRLFRALKEHENVPFGDNAFYYHRSNLLEQENNA